jgi:hypothetical protein
MAPQLWPLDPAAVDTKYKKRHPAEPTLPNTFIWATWTAAGSDYLQRLDADAPIDGLIDISHVRWAAMNAITAIDLCAATMGRLFCDHTDTKELDLRAFDRNSNRGADELRDALPEKFLDWVKTTLADQRYKDVLNARNPLTHCHLNRHLSMGTALPTEKDRTKFPVDGRAHPVNARDLVVMSAELALDRVRAFIEVVDQH